ncbi:MAG: hypothetical protein CME63_13495 [Halobacteriovoraceae bacterium]|nr:hypothetical protein [Halobacteriovoraceae bacterium]MBC98755.1 hypothetical protein [Halobacteriovoraceae bacterium]|tara:strand:- start:3937 stop:4275 length:339 start_codon:yes stop_codon:yes gene_type:complete
MKKIILAASLLLTIQSSFAVGAAIAVLGDSICEAANGPGSCVTQAPVGIAGASTTSTFAGVAAGLIVLADDGSLMIDTESEAAQVLCDSSVDELTEIELQVLQSIEATGGCQ